jgi:hypothetical protein
MSICVNRKLDSICNLQSVRSGLEAKFSLRMVAAMALEGIDTAAPGNFNDELVGRSALQQLFDRIRVELVEGASAGAARIAITLRSGQDLQQECDLEEPDLTSSSKAVRAKFTALVNPCLGAVRTAKLAAAIEGLDSCAEVSTLLEAARRES